MNEQKNLSAIKEHLYQTLISAKKIIRTSLIQAKAIHDFYTCTISVSQAEGGYYVEFEYEAESPFLKFNVNKVFIGLTKENDTFKDVEILNKWEKLLNNIFESTVGTNINNNKVNCEKLPIDEKFFRELLNSTVHVEKLKSYPGMEGYFIKHYINLNKIQGYLKIKERTLEFIGSNEDGALVEMNLYFPNDRIEYWKGVISHFKENVAKGFTMTSNHYQDTIDAYKERFYEYLTRESSSITEVEPLRFKVEGGYHDSNFILTKKEDSYYIDFNFYSNGRGEAYNTYERDELLDCPVNQFLVGKEKENGDPEDPHIYEQWMNLINILTSSTTGD